MAARAPLAGAGLAALAAGVVLLVSAPGADRVLAGGRAVPVFITVIGWSFAAVGAFVARRRPDTRTGLLLVAFGLTVLGSGLVISDVPVLYLLSGFADPLAIAVFVHLLLAFPQGRLAGRPARVVTALLYATALGGAALAAPFDAGCAACPANPVLLDDAPDVASAVHTVQRAFAIVLILVALGLLVRRWRTSGGAVRRAFAPLAGAGAVTLALGTLSGTSQDLGAPPSLQQAAQLVFIGTFALLPAAFLLGLVRGRFFRVATVGQLLGRLTAERRDDGLGGALAAALGDPSVRVAHWLPEQDAYVDHDGRPFAVPPDSPGAAATEVVHQGRRVGVLVHDPALRDDPQLLAAATGATALALVNERLEVELRARVEALRVSRARLVEAGDAERRRLGRDLHDGAQQRLVALLIDLQLALDRVPDGDGRELVGSALEHARAAVVELRELAAGIHPAVLSQRGLGAALETLAARSTVPVQLELRLQERLPSPVETAAYFVVAEALTNVAKYARATHARVGLRRERDRVVVEIVDDGIGGAEAGAGSGLRGLADRVGAVDGTFELRSPPGLGTIVRARF